MERVVASTKDYRPIQPGVYRYKRYFLLPWLTVRVIKDSIGSPDVLRVRCAGITLPAEVFLSKGEWQGPI